MCSLDACDSQIALLPHVLIGRLNMFGKNDTADPAGQMSIGSLPKTKRNAFLETFFVERNTDNSCSDVSYSHARLLSIDCRFSAIVNERYITVGSPVLVSD